MEDNHLFPVFFKLNQLHVLVVGGGDIGHEKVNALLENCPSAYITVVAINFQPELLELVKDAPNVELIRKPFSCGDMLGKDLAIAATGDRELNQYIWEKAKSSRVLINVADTPELCDFYLGSIVQKGQLKIAISTNGKSPTVAKRLKEVLQEVIPSSLNDVLDKLQVIRDRIKGDFTEKVKQLNRITDVLVRKD